MNNFGIVEEKFQIRQMFVEILKLNSYCMENREKYEPIISNESSERIFRKYYIRPAAPPGFWFGGGTLGGNLKFSKNFKRFLRKLQRMHYFSLFFKKIKNPVNISSVSMKNTNCWEIFRKFLIKIQLNNFLNFSIGGGGDVPCVPRLCKTLNVQVKSIGPSF